MAQNKEHSEHHVIPFKILSNVMIGLLVLTVLTVVTAKGIHLGVLAAPVAFLIAFVKAMMVMMYFMGLKYDTRGNQVIFATGFIFLAVLFFTCAFDIWTRIQVQSTL